MILRLLQIRVVSNVWTEVITIVPVRSILCDVVESDGPVRSAQRSSLGGVVEQPGGILSEHLRDTSAALILHLQFHIYLFIMFQRTIFRQAQAARSILSTSPSTASLALRRTTQQRLPALRPFAPQTSRFFSTEKETKEGENAEAEAENTDAAKLEAKEREVIELKVPTFPVKLPASEVGTE